MVPSALLNRWWQRAARLSTRSNRELLVELVRAQLRGSDQGSVLGLLWSLGGPIVMLVVLYSVFSARFGAEVPAYPLYLLLGIVLVSFFGAVTGYMLSVFPSQRSLLLNSTVPSETLIASRLVMIGYKLATELLLCTALSVWYGLFSWRTLLLVPPLLIAYAGLALGVGLALAVARAFARDLEHLWGLTSRVLFIATPVFYTLDGASSPTRTILYWLNPLTPFVESFRLAFMGGEYGSWGSLAHSLLVGLGAFAIGYSVFLWLEHSAVEQV